MRRCPPLLSSLRVLSVLSLNKNIFIGVSFHSPHLSRFLSSLSALNGTLPPSLPPSLHSWDLAPLRSPCMRTRTIYYLFMFTHHHNKITLFLFTRPPSLLLLYKRPSKDSCSASWGLKLGTACPVPLTVANTKPLLLLLLLFYNRPSKKSINN